MTRRTTTPTTVVASKQGRSTKELVAIGVFALIGLSMCGNQVDNMSAGGAAKAGGIAAGAGAGAGLGLGGAALGAACARDPRACSEALKNLKPRTDTGKPLAPPVTAPRPTVPLPPMPTPTVRGRPVAPPAPSVPKPTPTTAKPKDDSRQLGGIGGATIDRCTPIARMNGSVAC